MEQMRQNELRISNKLLGNMKKFAFVTMLIMMVVVTVASSVWASETLPGDVLVVFKAEPNTKVTDESLSEGGYDAVRVATIAKALDASIVEFYPSLSKLKNVIFVLLHSDTKSEKVLAEELLSLPEVLSASPNYKVNLNEGEPNDPLYKQETNEWEVSQWGLKAIRAPEAWKITTGNYDTYVAVIDSGVYYGHEDIVLNFDHPDSRNFYGGLTSLPIAVDPNSYHDENGHGTHVAGIIGAYGNNGEGITGVNWQTQIISLRIAGKDGHGNLLDIGDSLMTQALNYVAEILERYPERRIVINISFGGCKSKTPEEMERDNDPCWLALSALSETNRALICVSAGNEGLDIGFPAPKDDPSGKFKKGQYHYPSSYRNIDNMIVVANARQANGYSRYDKSSYSSTYVDVAAPGTNIYSTFSKNHDSYYDNAPYKIINANGNLYINMSGTSMSTPFVSGTAALLLSKYPNASAEDIANAIRLGANSYYAKDYTKYGFLNIEGAFRYMAGQPVPIGVPIDEFIFPDENFRSYVATAFDKDGNGYLSEEEISRAKIINVSGRHVANLTGIENFKNLVQLDCSNTDIESFDLYSSQAKQNDKLVDINFCDCKKLLSVHFQSRKRLVSLNLEGCSALTIVECSDNAHLQNLNINGCVALTGLTCSKSSLTELNLTGLSSLTTLDCSWNKIRLLDISTCSLLDMLNCDHNNIAALDLRSCPLLTSERVYLASQDCLGLQIYLMSDRKYEVHFSDFMPASSDVFIGVIPDTIQAYADGGDATDYLITYQKTYDPNTGILTFENVSSSDFAVTPVRIEYKYVTYPAKTIGIMGFDNPFCMDATVRLGKYETGKIWDDDDVDDIHIPLSKTFFPDDNFRNYCSSYIDSGGDGVIDGEEIAAVTRIDVLDKGVTSLKGIEYFTALRELVCGKSRLIPEIGPLTELDVSRNTALTYLECSENQLTELDVSHNTALETLGCNNNYLTVLDVSNNKALKKLYCSANNLNLLDVSNNTALTYLSCLDNKLTGLDVSHNTALETLGCSNNPLRVLNVRNNTALKDLHCGSNQLTELDVSNNRALQILWCPSNQLTALNVRNNTALKTLWCRDNQITALDLTNNTNLSLVELQQGHKTPLRSVRQSDGFYYVRLSNYIPDILSKISSVTGYSSSFFDKPISSEYDPTTGIAKFSELPLHVSYKYDTGRTNLADNYRYMLVNISIPAEPVIVTDYIPEAETEKPYSFAIDATSKNTKSWEITAGSLPAGLTLGRSTGKITGTPTETGIFTFTVKVGTSDGNDLREFTMSVKTGIFAPTITTTSLPDGRVNEAYSATLSATGTLTITWSTSGLPDGLSCSSGGDITGTPTVQGTFTVTATATNVAGSTLKTFEVTIRSSGKSQDDDPSKPTFRSHSLILEGEIGVNFYMNLPSLIGVDYDDHDKCYMEFDISGDKSNALKYKDANIRYTENGKTYYGFRCYISSVQMADTITAVLHYGDNFTVSQDYSVQEYLDAILDGDFSVTAKDLMIAIQNYGYYAQQMLSKANNWTIGDKYAAMEHASQSDYDATEIARAKENTAQYAIYRDVGSSQIQKVQYSLLLDSKTTVNVYLEVKEGYTGTVTATLDGGADNVATKLSNKEYLVQIGNIPVHELSTIHTIKVTAGDSFTVKVAALSYVYTVLNLTAEKIGGVDIATMRNGVTALYEYYDAAMTYAGRN